MQQYLLYKHSKQTES